MNHPVCYFKMSLLRIICAILLITVIPSCSLIDQLLNKNNDVIRVPGVDLRSVYSRLEHGGFDPGYYKENDSRQLSESIRRFQRLAKLEENGILDRVTWGKLRKLHDPLPSELGLVRSRGASYNKRDTKNIPYDQKTSPARKTSPVRKTSSQSRWPVGVVKVIQEMLTKQGYGTGNLNGSMDTGTREAIRRFQKNHGLKISGNLNSRTLVSILGKSCKDGCKFRMPLTASDIRSLSALPLPAVRKFSGTFLETILIQGFQAFLNKLGYHAGTPDGIIGKDTQKAVRRFQKEHGIEGNGELNHETVLSVFLKGCGDRCTFTISQEIIRAKPERATSSTTPGKVKPIKRSPINPRDYPVNINDKAFAVEKSECSAILGDWVIFYCGTVTDKKNDAVSVRVEKRFGYRYYPDKEGVDNTDWWCIPKKRHCYSAIKFSDWEGKYSENQIVPFPISQVYNAKVKIINGMSAFLIQNCNR